MAKVCCIEGCPTAIEGTFFKFPNSKTFRNKWLDVITTKHNNKRLIEDSLVCSVHFLEDQYEVVRGKTRLKAKVVPSLLIGPKSKTPEKASTPKPDKEDGKKKKIKEKENAKENNEDRNSAEVDTSSSIPTEPPDKETSVEDVPEKTTTDVTSSSKSKKTSVKKKEDAQKKQKTQEAVHGAENMENKDIEEIITNYLIKQTVPNKIHSPENIEPAGQMNGNRDVIEINDEHAEPQFIEISADKGQNGQPDGQDCLMVLENVQVEIDPSLVFPEYEEEEGGDCDSDVIDLGEKKNDPISLLTSSDEDEVIIEEPNIDTVEVSDATDDGDEDDMPLVKLLKTKKKAKEKKLALQQVMWGGYEYYCVQCHYTTQNACDFRKHKASHSKVFEVCTVCNYTTPSKSQFIRHKRKHKFEKRYQCHRCDYKAKHHMSLLYHLKTHTSVNFKQCFVSSSESVLSEKPKSYKCDQCKYRSLRRSDLKRHRRRVHDDDDDQDMDYSPG